MLRIGAIFVNITYRTTNFLLGAVIGAIVSLIIGLLLTPQSGQATRAHLRDRGLAFKTKVTNEREIFSERVRSATDEWIAKLRATANDMAAKGYISTEEADAQINTLLEKVRG